MFSLKSVSPVTRTFVANAAKVVAIQAVARVAINYVVVKIVESGEKPDPFVMLNTPRIDWKSLTN